MALATTTLSTALTGEGPLAETSIVVASATSLAAGRIIRMGGIGGERMLVAKAYIVGSTTVPVLRGWDGSLPKTWPASANQGRATSGTSFQSPARGCYRGRSWWQRR